MSKVVKDDGARRSRRGPHASHKDRDAQRDDRDRGRERSRDADRGKSSKRGLKRKNPSVVVDFAKLQMDSLVKYKNQFNLNDEVRAGTSKRELLAVVKRHFSHGPKLKDAETIALFLKANEKAKQDRHKAISS